MIVVFNLEFGSPLQAAPERFIMAGSWLAPAVPKIESWLLADPRIFELHRGSSIEASEQHFREYLARTELHFLNQKEKVRLSSKRFKSNYDPYRAAMHSASLRSFIRLIGNDDVAEGQDLQIDINKTTLSNLVREYYPSERPIYRTLEGNIFTGELMAEEILRGSEVGKKYSSDLLRVCRDLLARQAASLNG